MKKFMSLLLGMILIASLSSCDEETKYDDVIKTESETIKLSEEFRKQITINIDESSIKNDVATIKITQPDLIKIFEEVLAQKSNEQDEKLLNQMTENLGKYTIEKSVETPVTNSDGKWELITSEDVDTEIENAINEFLVYFLSQVKFTKISWEESK